MGLIVGEALASKCLIREGLLNRYRSVCTRVPHLEQNTSFTVSALPQLTHAGRALAGAASDWTGLMGVPHFVQNRSLGSASLPHVAQVQPVRRNRAIREPTPSPPKPEKAGADATGTGAACAAGPAAAARPRS